LASASVLSHCSGQSWQDLDLVFRSRVGTTIGPSNLVHQHFYPLLRRAGLPHIRFHDLRHTAATLLLFKHIPTKVVSEMFGHASPTITQMLYAHVTPDMQEWAVTAMEEVFDGETAARAGLSRSQLSSKPR
jgi:integrase